MLDLFKETLALWVVLGTINVFGGCAILALRSQRLTDLIPDSLLKGAVCFFVLVEAFGFLVFLIALVTWAWL